MEYDSALFSAENQSWAVTLARKYRSRRGVPAGVLAHGELEQAALIGLWRAERRFDPTMGKEFKAFARMAVIGAVADELRSSYMADRRRRPPPKNRPPCSRRWSSNGSTRAA
ncbi:MAG TPA: sigma factor [Planctomycetota bacterium]|jgi:DNA-directed RNA polymerase specialized sigma subunit